MQRLKELKRIIDEKTILLAINYYSSQLNLMTATYPKVHIYIYIYKSIKVSIARDQIYKNRLDLVKKRHQD